MQQEICLVSHAYCWAGRDSICDLHGDGMSTRRGELTFTSMKGLPWHARRGQSGKKGGNRTTRVSTLTALGRAHLGAKIKDDREQKVNVWASLLFIALGVVLTIVILPALQLDQLHCIGHLLSQTCGDKTIIDQRNIASHYYLFPIEAILPNKCPFVQNSSVLYFFPDLHIFFSQHCPYHQQLFVTLLLDFSSLCWDYFIPFDSTRSVNCAKKALNLAKWCSVKQ